MRQYIGARYVPLLFNHNGSNDWLPNRGYEPLTIVTYNNVSYTSTTTVPANIGNPAENPIYWVMTGNYMGQINEVWNKLNEVSEAITSLDGETKDLLNWAQNKQKLYGRYFLLLGDSYGVGYSPDGEQTGWCPILKTYIEYMGGKADINPVFGAGWTKEGNTYLNQLNNMSNPSKYTDIFIAGGYNDRNATNNQIANAMNGFMGRVKEIAPYARVYYALIGNHSTSYEDRTKISLNNVEMWNNQTYITYVPYAFNILHSRSLFTSDGFHPNLKGHVHTAAQFLNYILGGEVRPYYSHSYGGGESAQILGQNVRYNYYKDLTPVLSSFRANSYIIVKENLYENNVVMPTTIAIMAPYTVALTINGQIEVRNATMFYRENNLGITVYGKSGEQIEATKATGELESGALFYYGCDCL